jgi:hypothetical protein
MESNLIPTIALVVSIISLVASVLSFWFVNLNKGVVVFSKPNIAYIEHRPDERVVFACPVTVTNTGAVVHTVNFLKMRVERVGENWTRDLSMFVEFDNWPATRVVTATGFAVPPRSSVTKLIGFVSDKPEKLETGTYECHLTSFLDGAATSANVPIAFRVSVDPSTIKLIKQSGWFLNYRVYETR